MSGYFSDTVDFNPGSGTDSHASNGGLDAFLSKFDSIGNLIWARTWGGVGEDAGNGLAADSTRGVLVSGHFTGTVDLDPGSGVNGHTSLGSKDVFLSKFDSNGNLAVTKVWGGTGDDFARDLVLDVSGNVSVVGSFSNSVDFDPANGLDHHSSNGGDDAYLNSKVDLCSAPLIATQPLSQSIGTGGHATLSVIASGDAALHYQWYQGTSGSLGTPVGSDSSSFTTPSLSVSTQYWVRVSNGCGHSDSNTATISLGSGCVGPDIDTEPQSQSISSGSTARLTLVVTGDAPRHYHWYRGASGDTANPVGTIQTRTPARRSRRRPAIGSPSRMAAAMPTARRQRSRSLDPPAPRSCQ